MIIAVEGIDGAGKSTAISQLTKELTGEREVAYLRFPQYDDTPEGRIIRRALYGKERDLTESIAGMATLFALDRLRAKDLLERYAPGGDRHEHVLLLDRYVASNAAYSMAREALRDDCPVADKRESVGRWIAHLEFDELGLPKPQCQLFLSADDELAGARARRRESDIGQKRDLYETQRDLQAATYEAYRLLCAANWGSTWVTIRQEYEVIADVLVNSGIY